MAAPRRRIPDQSAKQLRRAPETPRKSLLARLWTDVRVRLASYVVTGGLLALVATAASPAPRLDPWSVPARRALEEWTQIAGGLTDTVSPRLLLGADGTDPALDAALKARGLSRAAFRRAANAAVHVAGACSDEMASAALAISYSEVPLPEGIKIPAAIPPVRVIRTPAIEAARALVLDLSARIATSVASPEDS
jgi:hypothetical protein